MTIVGGQAEQGGEGVAREAAHWFARMRGPDAGASRTAFEAWLAQGSVYLAAYNRAGEIFAMGKLLADPHPPVSVSTPARRRTVPAIAIASIVACLAGIGGWAVWHRSAPASAIRDTIAAATDHRRFVTMTGETRSVRLADGSNVRMGEGTILDIDVGSDHRTLRLLQGQARFEVANGKRPLTLFADGGSVTACGTIFEVALARSGKVDVRLLQGVVDVTLPRSHAVAVPSVRRLGPGESISWAAEPQAATTQISGAGASSGTSGLVRDVEGVPVADLIAQANRNAVRPIRLVDASIADQRVSGRFRIDDSELLARRLGALFGRKVDTRRAGEIVLASTDDRPAYPMAAGRQSGVPGGALETQ